MGGQGCIFLERVSQSKLEYLLVLLSVPSVPLLMGYGRDPCVPLPAQLVHYLPSSDLLKTERQPASKTDGVLQLLKKLAKEKG